MSILLISKYIDLLQTCTKLTLLLHNTQCGDSSVQITELTSIKTPEDRSATNAEEGNVTKSNHV